MILNGNRRGGARDLALHLTKSENEHVEIHEMRGFVADTLLGAFREAEAISRGTQCTKFLYSLSLSPPETENVPVAAFENAIDRIERKLGLAGHARAIVFHEKHGRRHAHCVWSRINPDSMKAAPMSHDWLKLGDVSRELYMEHGWRMPEGLIDPTLRSPLNFDRHEWLKAQRAGKDPRDVKAALQQCWAASDSGKALRHALEQRGYYLAKGDRRGVVAIDTAGEVYALSRWSGVREKNVAARFGDAADLPSVDAVRQHVAGLVRQKVTGFIATVTDEFARAAGALEGHRTEMVARHRAVRSDQKAAQESRASTEARLRADRFRKGVLGLWDRITGQHARLRGLNETDAAACEKRDEDERQALIEHQLEERRRLQLEIAEERRLHAREMARLHRQMAERSDNDTRRVKQEEEERRRRARSRSGPTF